MRPHAPLLALFIAPLTAGFAATPAHAGPLTPPAGAPAPTYKTLDQVRPGIPLEDTGATIVLSSPRHYYLTENVSSVGIGIVITTTGVTLDLNGYTVLGNLSGDAGHHGILINPSFPDDRPVTITNGSVHNFSGDGITTDSNLVTTVLDRVHVSDCQTGGIDLQGNLTATHCTAVDNGGTGIYSRRFAVIESCQAIGNDGDGIGAEYATIRSCVAAANTGDGIYAGFNTADGSAIAGCLVRENGGDGIRAERFTAISHCTAQSNDGNGIRTGAGGNVAHCATSNNSLDGFALGSGSTVTGSTAYSNTVHGFDLASGCGAHHCTARENNDDGFNTSAACHVANCISLFNGGNGFLLSSDSTARHCSADSNGTNGDSSDAGFRGFNDTTIDSCTATDHNTGFSGGTGSLIIRCTAGNNTTNYSVSAGSDFGPIVSQVGVITTTNPFANLEF